MYVHGTGTELELGHRKNTAAVLGFRNEFRAFRVFPGRRNTCVRTYMTSFDYKPCLQVWLSLHLFSINY